MYAMNEWFNLYNNKERYESNEINNITQKWTVQQMEVPSWCMYI